MDMQSIFWVGFFVFIIFMLILDLGVFNKEAHEIKVKEAITWSVVWICLSLIFSSLIYVGLGHQKALEFLTGYVIEKSLSVDNLFIFIMIFSYFHIKKAFQHKILFWGIIGALLMRAVFIFAGIKIIESFHFVIYIFGAFLIFTGIKMLFESKEEIDFEEKIIVKFIKKLFPISKHKDDGKFFTVENGKRYATPLFVALVMIEFTDLVFAVDSIPAILAISNNMFIVYTSNIFAILGLRSLYFALSGIMGKFVYLKYGLAGVLSFVGVKMLISGYYVVPILSSLLIIICFLAMSIIASYIIKPEEHTHIAG
ncbi:MAG: TerC family protein [Candidatus Gracilibacteria bacterium]|nr:TerC family protein [Candidatus Gracilibacteria bacterium]